VEVRNGDWLTELLRQCAHPGGAAITRADVASMTRAQREALERRAMHGVKISF
jgi:hypothetical protein